MGTNAISFSRRHVLGDFYSRCDAVVNVPVYLDTPEGEMIGYVDQGLGNYADAFSFHLYAHLSPPAAIAQVLNGRPSS